MKYLLIAVVAVSAAACSASKVNVRGPSNAPYAPLNEQGITGEVAYCNAGIRTVRNARRDDAYRKMHAQCGGAYEIVREEDQRPAWCQMERRIWFKCATAAAPSPLVPMQPAAAAGVPQHQPVNQPHELDPAKRCDSCGRISVP